MMRLGLLLGDRIAQCHPTQQSANQTDETFTSVSSLASSETERENSPMSTMTGQFCFCFLSFGFKRDDGAAVWTDIVPEAIHN